MYACLYFDSDKSISVLPKSRCKLRGPFEPKSEVEVDWHYEGGQKERHIATVLRIAGKDKKAELERFADEADEQICNLIAHGKSPKSHLDDLCHLTSDDDNGGKTSTPIATKRPRKQTAVMLESLEQESELEPKKKSRSKTTRKKNQQEGTPSKQKAPSGVASKKVAMKRAENSSSLEAELEIIQNTLLPVFSGSFPPREKEKDHPEPINSTTEARNSTPQTSLNLSADGPLLQELLGSSTPKPAQRVPGDHEHCKTAEGADPNKFYHELQLSETLRTAIDAANNVSATSFGADQPPESPITFDETFGAHDVSGDSLKEQNANLRRELEQLKQQSETSCNHPVPSRHVLDFMRLFLQSYESTGAGVLPVLPHSPAKAFSISANFVVSQDSKAGQRVRLLQGVDVFVDRGSLRNDVASAHKKGPLHLLSRLLSSVFTPEELAHSCGQGLTPGKNTGDRKPLDPTRVAACKDYVTAFCIENNKEQPTTKQINEAITNQVSYARVKLQRRSTAK